MHYLSLFIATLFLTTSNVGDKTIPTATLKTFDGESVEIKDYTTNGKIQMVSLWATWCGPCRMELDAISKVYPEWKEKYDIEVIAVSLDSRGAIKGAKQMVEGKDWPFTFMHDNKQELSGQLGLRGIPFSMLIDGEGKIISKQEGYYPGYEKDIEKKIKKHYKKGKS